MDVTGADLAERAVEGSQPEEARLAESRTCIVKVNEPAVAGRPAMRPLGSRFNPAGRLPDPATSDQVSAPLPAVACNCVL